MALFAKSNIYGELLPIPELLDNALGTGFAFKRSLLPFKELVSQLRQRLTSFALRICLMEIQSGVFVCGGTLDLPNRVVILKGS